jgi:hypothetical protein
MRNLQNTFPEIIKRIMFGNRSNMPCYGPVHQSMDDFFFHLQYEESVRDNEAKFCEGDPKIVTTGSCVVFVVVFLVFWGSWQDF